MYTQNCFNSLKAIIIQTPANSSNTKTCGSINISMGRMLGLETKRSLID